MNPSGPGNALKRPRGHTPPGLALDPDRVIDERVPEPELPLTRCRRMALASGESFQRTVRELLNVDAVAEIARREAEMRMRRTPGVDVPDWRAPVCPCDEPALEQASRRAPLGRDFNVDTVMKIEGPVGLLFRTLMRANGRVVSWKDLEDLFGPSVGVCAVRLRRLLPSGSIGHFSDGCALCVEAGALDGEKQVVGPFTVWPEQRAVLVAGAGTRRPAYLSADECTVFRHLLAHHGSDVSMGALRQVLGPHKLSSSLIAGVFRKIGEAWFETRFDNCRMIALPT